MPIYAVYRAKDDTQACMFQADVPMTDEQWSVLTETVDGEPMELVAEYWARDWESAKKAEEAILWG